MGLDISVYKPVPLDGRDIHMVDTFNLTEHPNLLEAFKSIAFEHDCEYWDIEAALKKKGLNSGDYSIAGYSFGGHNDQCRIELRNKTSKEEIELINPSTFTKREWKLAVEEVGYQRKGGNKKFYEDGMWSSPAVISKKVLLDHWEKYFSHQTPDSPGGWGSGVEFKMTDEEMEMNFKRNIIDKFKEGEHFVIYH